MSGAILKVYEMWVVRSDFDNHPIAAFQSREQAISFAISVDVFREQALEAVVMEVTRK